MEPIIYRLQGDVRSLSRMRITTRRTLSQVQQTGIILSIELEKQHAGRPLYTGPLHIDMDFYFTSTSPLYKRKYETNHTYHDKRPYLSTLMGFIEQIGEGVIFNNGISITSLRCAKLFTTEPEPYLTFKVTELRAK